MTEEIFKHLKETAIEMLFIKPEELSIREFTRDFSRRTEDGEFPPLTVRHYSMTALISLSPLGDCTYDLYRSDIKVREVTKDAPLDMNVLYLYPDDPLRIIQTRGEPQPVVKISGYEVNYPHALIDNGLRFNAYGFTLSSKQT